MSILHADVASPWCIQYTHRAWIMITVRNNFALSSAATNTVILFVAVLDYHTGI
jgi:hypothetical protein